MTPALREWYLSDDIEELEYAALSRAALASLRLLAADPGAPRRRVVVAVDVPDGDGRGRPRPGARPGRARGGAGRPDPCRWRRRPRCTWTRRTRRRTWRPPHGRCPRRTAGDDDAQFVVDGAEDHELLWYATQEIPQLVARRLG
ncbi:hypothetical protein GCM10019016_111500 [Streptomyces prasinosporus]|uniref:Uncharacterized protein n=1 Tax=Streptomyces prasinosporus TaxID=68256 RepID=A0ABP6U8I8_9ACTN